MSIKMTTTQNLQDIYTLNDDQINDYCGRARGWVDYPTDSTECGKVWHLDKDRAPFGMVLNKQNWKPLESDSVAFQLMVDFGLIVRVMSSSDQTFVHVVGKTIITQKVDVDVYRTTRKAIALAVAHIYLSRDRADRL
jgi:hypothetical protein